MLRSVGLHSKISGIAGIYGIAGKKKPSLGGLKGVLTKLKRNVGPRNLKSKGIISGDVNHLVAARIIEIEV